MVSKANITDVLRRLRPLIVVLAIQVLLVSFLVPFLVWRQTRDLNSPAVSVRLLSTGTVIWGDEHVLLNDIKPSLKRTLSMLRHDERKRPSAALVHDPPRNVRFSRSVEYHS